MTQARSQQQTARVVATTDPAARAEQVTLRVVSRETVFARAEQITARMVSSNVPDDVPVDPEDPEFLDRYFASVPNNILEIACLEFSHTSWSEPHRRVIQPNDWTVSINGVPTLFPGWNENGAWFGEYPATDDASRGTRVLNLDDPFNDLHQMIEDVAESMDPVVVRLWLFRSDVLDTPMIAERYEVQTSVPGADRLQVTCVGRDLSNLVDPYIRHTRINSPGLRGR